MKEPFPLTWPFHWLILLAKNMEESELGMIPQFYNHPQHCDNIGDTFLKTPS